MKDSLDEGVWPEAVDPLLNRALGLKDYWMGEGLKNELDGLVRFALVDIESIR